MVEELEQELANTNRLADALSNLQAGGGAAQDVGQGVEGLQERVDELKQERDNWSRRSKTPVRTLLGRESG